MQIKAKIIGVGHALGEDVLTNSDLEKMVETNDEWIVERTGIRERRIAKADTYTSDLAYRASREALEDAGLSPMDLDLIIVATVTPDFLTPAVSCIVQAKLGADRAAAYDINQACTGLVGGLTMAQQFIENGKYRHILVVGADALSKVTDYKDRKTCILFGDGAGAVVVSRNEDPDDDSRIVAAKIGAVGSLGHNLTLPFLRMDEEEKAKRVSKDLHSLWMDGSEVFKFAVRIMAEAVKETLADVGMTVDDIDLLIPHQANTRIIDGAVKRIKINPDKVFVNLPKYGNMSAASIGVALKEAIDEGRVKRGDTIVLVGFGGGLTWGCTILKW